MEDSLYISALQHYAYCPRQFALIHIEQVWEENSFTAEGRHLHERVDSGVHEQRRGIRQERGVQLLSHRHRIIGKMDLLEIEPENRAGRATRYFPVEYKRGKPKVEDWDRIQLCAQALCIEEMRDVRVEEGAIWYWEVRRREAIVVDDNLRNATVAVIEAAHALLSTGHTPPPIENKKRCRACSLVEVCAPVSFGKDRSVRYVEELFREETS